MIIVGENTRVNLYIFNFLGFSEKFLTSKKTQKNRIRVRFLGLSPIRLLKQRRDGHPIERKIQLQSVG